MAKKKATTVKLNGYIPEKLFRNLTESANRRGWEVSDEIRWVLETWDRLRLLDLLCAALESTVANRFLLSTPPSNGTSGDPTNEGFHAESLFSQLPQEFDLIEELKRNLMPKALECIREECNARDERAIWGILNTALIFNYGMGGRVISGVDIDCGAVAE